MYLEQSLSCQKPNDFQVSISFGDLMYLELSVPTVKKLIGREMILSKFQSPLEI